MSFVEQESKLGLKPVEKYGPTGEAITTIIVDCGVFTPKEFYMEMWIGRR
jgi:hypothetical protein